MMGPGLNFESISFDGRALSMDPGTHEVSFVAADVTTNAVAPTLAGKF